MTIRVTLLSPTFHIFVTFRELIHISRFQRSKYICVPRNVREAGNHFIWDFHEGFSLNVPTSVGFLHHYRVCEFGGDDCVQTESVVDRTVAERYKEELTSAIDKVLMDASAAGCISEGGKRAPLS